jgi:hypothetical protein
MFKVPSACWAIPGGRHGPARERLAVGVGEIRGKMRAAVVLSASGRASAIIADYDGASMSSEICLIPEMLFVYES